MKAALYLRFTWNFCLVYSRTYSQKPRLRPASHPCACCASAQTSWRRCKRLLWRRRAGSACRATERRIAMLRSMAADDPLDKLLEEELRGPSHHAEDEVEPPFVSETDLKTRRKRIPPNWFRLLLFIGEEGKSSDEVRSFLSANGDLGITPDASRTGLMNYRKEYGFVDSPGRGFYKLTPLGTAAMKAQIESPDIWR